MKQEQGQEDGMSIGQRDVQVVSVAGWGKRRRDRKQAHRWPVLCCRPKMPAMSSARLVWQGRMGV